MDHESLLAVLPGSQAEAISMKEISRAMGLEVSTHTDWIRAERKLARSLRALIKWGWVARDRRQNEDGHRFWFNTYWKTEIASQEISQASQEAAVLLQAP